MRVLFIIALLSAPAAARAQALELVCHGIALHTETTVTEGSVETDDGRSATGEATTYRPTRTQESLRIRLDGAGGGKLKMPEALIPTFSLGKHGWWDFTKLDVNDDKIRAQFSLNILNHPSILVDRHTGEIEMRGFGVRFNGSCERAPEAPQSRKF